MVVGKVQHFSGSSLHQVNALFIHFNELEGKYDFTWEVSDFKWAFISLYIILPNINSSKIHRFQLNICWIVPIVIFYHKE